MEINIRSYQDLCDSIEQLKNNIKTCPECTSFVFVTDFFIMYGQEIPIYNSMLNDLLQIAAETFTCLEKLELKFKEFEARHLENIVDIISRNPKLKSLKLIQFYCVQISLAKLSDAIVASSIEEISFDNMKIQSSEDEEDEFLRKIVSRDGITEVFFCNVLHGNQFGIVCHSLARSVNTLTIILVGDNICFDVGETVSDLLTRRTSLKNFRIKKIPYQPNQTNILYGYSNTRIMQALEHNCTLEKLDGIDVGDMMTPEKIQERRAKIFAMKTKSAAKR